MPVTLKTSQTGSKRLHVADGKVMVELCTVAEVEKQLASDYHRAGNTDEENASLVLLGLVANLPCLEAAKD